MSWKEHVAYFESLLNTEDDPELIEYYVHLIDIWEEVGRLVQLHGFDVTDSVPH